MRRMEQLLCEHCAENPATYRCERCGRSLCAGCCLHADILPDDATDPDGVNFFRACPICRSDAVVAHPSLS
jgi:hypothetical protein